MTFGDNPPTFSDGQSPKLHNEPLLGRRTDHERLYDQDDDLERADGEPIESSSRQSSFDFADAPLVETSIRRNWRARFHRYAPFCAGFLRGRRSKSRPATRAKPRYLRIGLSFVVITLLVLGVIQFVSLSFLTLAAIFPNQAAYIVDHWGDPTKTSQGLLHWPTDFSRDIQPVPCHSHNDYWRKVPLYSALQAGCIGVEADVWLVDDDLYVGHSTSSLTSNRTFRNLYVNPLLDILTKQNPTTKFHPNRGSTPNGVFDTDPAQTLVLLIDFKIDGHTLWPYVQAQLDPLRRADYLTYFDGTSRIERPITAVATGNAPFDLLTSNSTYRDIFFDAPLDKMSVESPSSGQESKQGTSSNAPTNASLYNPTNSYYASTSFDDSIGTVWSNPSNTQLENIRAQIRGAHNQGLKARYWETPFWPRGLRNHVWNVLIEEGVDILNVDDLKAATQGTWGEWR